MVTARRQTIGEKTDDFLSLRFVGPHLGDHDRLEDLGALVAVSTACSTAAGACRSGQPKAERMSLSLACTAVAFCRPILSRWRCASLNRSRSSSAKA